eukprot:3755465-Prorocentrum_lima.AAC.1
MLYDSGAPPTRRLHINGLRGPKFSLRSGVAQGCPLSPLLFLFITEGLSRLITDDAAYRGVVVNGVEHR